MVQSSKSAKCRFSSHTGVVSSAFSIFDISRPAHVSDGMTLLYSINAKQIRAFGGGSNDLGPKYHCLLSICVYCY